MFTLPAMNLLLKARHRRMCWPWVHECRWPIYMQPKGRQCAREAMQLNVHSRVHALRYVQDAASSGRLDSWPARLLNAGQLVAALPHLAVLLPKGEGACRGGAHAGQAGACLSRQARPVLSAVIAARNHAQEQSPTVCMRHTPLRQAVLPTRAWISASPRQVKLLPAWFIAL